MDKNMETVLKTNSQPRAIAYWIMTSIIVLQSLAGAYMDLSGNPAFVETFAELGYPPYLLVILGVWRVLAAIALVIPGYRRLKEWAYAGLFFDLSGAVASHLFIGDVTGAVFPFLFTCIAMASWALRPADRRL